ncbi:MAG: PKD domain-containing protein [Deltaproteobacteria bacterium]|nr:PKD domain-containing protein [Deltaproteobacteria bacterium]
MRLPRRVARGATLSMLVLLSIGGTGRAAGDGATAHDKVSPVLRTAVPSARLVRARADGQRHVYLHLDATRGLDRVALEAAGARIERVSARLGVVQAWIPADRLDTVAALPSVTRITPAVYGVARAGSAQTEGDPILRSDALRELGFDGTGVKVGVVSDGIDSLGLSQATGDSPQVTIIDGQSGSGDEGTATIEIVHDVAPGAAIGFCGGGQDNGVTTVDFVDCANKLVTEFGADVIVDDLGFPAEPYFEDGVVAQTVRQIVGSGVLWVTAAGNDAQKHYQGDYQDSGNPFHAHDFGDGQVAMLVDVPPGGGTAFLEWANPYGAATDVYGVCFTDPTGSSLGTCSDRLLGETVPLAVLDLPCEGPANCTPFLLVGKAAGLARPIEMFFDRAKPRTLATAADSIYGHPCVQGVVSVVAIDAADPGHDTAEAFDSQGPCTIYFPAGEVREKPELAAIDGVTVSGAGGFQSPFHGTSAAAPHVAGIAALLAQAFPGRSEAQLDQAMSQSAIDVGATGFDPVFGSGRVDALAAAQFLDNPPDGTIVAPAATTVIVPGASAVFAGSCSDPDGASGLAAHWDFGAGSGVAPSTALDPGEKFFQVTGTFEVKLTCSDAFGTADPTPATRTIIVGVPPDGTIDQPVADLTIVAGEPVSFAASCTDPDDSGGLTHRWSFGEGSGVPDSSAEDAGAKTFSTPGTFTVTYTCADGGGAADPTPATRVITVDAAPDSTIDAPAADVTIAKGGSVSFAGTCVDSESEGPLTPTWSFGAGSGIANSNVLAPGSVVFPKAGTFTISFACKDRRGIPDPTPATRVVTVTGKNKSSGGGCNVASAGGPGAGATAGLAAAMLALCSWARERRRGARR